MFPLPVPSDLDLPDDVILQNSLESALAMLDSEKLASTIENVFVIGGGAVYEEAMKLPQCTQIHLTWVKKEFECDAFFPKFEGMGFKESTVRPPLHAPHKAFMDLHLQLLLTCSTLIRLCLPAAVVVGPVRKRSILSVCAFRAHLYRIQPGGNKPSLERPANCGGAIP